jgi:threonine aldolase
MIVDFRSDTLTLPTLEMKNYMLQAPMGDDVFGEDPTVLQLEKKVSALFHKEAAMFCPSGTMANQIAIKAHSVSPGELICDALSHVYLYEGGGIAFHSGLSVALVEGERGIMTCAQIQEKVNPVHDYHRPLSQLVVLENTCNRGGGSCYTLTQMQEIYRYCQLQKIPLHLDGARIFNAITSMGYSSEDVGPCFDSISICLSKGLGAPIGSVLVGSANFIDRARRLRKLLGGGMRQVGMMAAAGIYALNHHVERLKEDHRHAVLLSEKLKEMYWIDFVFPVETNIVIIQLKQIDQVAYWIEKLAGHGIKVVPFGKGAIRWVTHLHIDTRSLDYCFSVLDQINRNL